MLTTDTMPLGQLKKGQTAIIEEVVGTPQEVSKLSALGFVAGAIVRMLTPGCACALQLGDTRLVLRCEQSRSIQVSPLY